MNLVLYTGAVSHYRKYIKGNKEPLEQPVIHVQVINIVEYKYYPSFSLAKGVHFSPSSFSDNVYCFPWEMNVSSIFSGDHRALSSNQ